MKSHERTTKENDERRRLEALSAAYRLILEAGSRAQQAATPKTPDKDVGVAASSASEVVPDASPQEGYSNG